MSLERFHSVMIDDLYLRSAVYETRLKQVLPTAAIDLAALRADLAARDAGMPKSGRPAEDQQEEIELTLQRLGLGAGPGQPG